MTKFDPYRKKTFTPYWNNFSIKPKKNQFTSLFLKKLKRKINKILPFKLKLILKNNKIDTYEMFSSFQTEDIIISYRNSLLTETVIQFLECFDLNYTKKNINLYVKEYCKVFSDTPVKDLNSGFGFNEGLFLYCIIKVIKPTMIIESGIMKGFTTYLMHFASPKNCVINCYDISFENIEFRSNKARYFNYDINEKPPSIHNQTVLAFWDDHTSQLNRLKFAIKNNIKFNIFDDDLSFLNFHSDGWPPIPTISMLYEIKKGIIKKQNINWISRGRKGKIFTNKFLHEDVTKHIITHKKFDDLFSMTGYKSHSQCSFVKLK